ncbi:MAG: hypothetical protein AB7O32_19735 [Vicinamibacterales bacterium]
MLYFGEDDDDLRRRELELLVHASVLPRVTRMLGCGGPMPDREAIPGEPTGRPSRNIVWGTGVPA